MPPRSDHRRRPLTDQLHSLKSVSSQPINYPPADRPFNAKWNARRDRGADGGSIKWPGRIDCVRPTKLRRIALGSSNLLSLVYESERGYDHIANRTGNNQPVPGEQGDDEQHQA